MLPGGQDVTMGVHEQGVRCLEWVANRGFLVSGSWDQVRRASQRQRQRRCHRQHRQAQAHRGASKPRTVRRSAPARCPGTGGHTQAGERARCACCGMLWRAVRRR